MMNDGLMNDGMMNDGLMNDGLMNDGLMNGGLMNDGLMNDGLMNGGLVDLKELFFEEYETSMAEIIEKVYRQPFPNRYLAGLSRFCADHMDDPRIHDLVYDHFVQFIRRNLVQYFEKNDQMVNDKMVNGQMVNGQMVNAVGFVGSVAYYYKPILEEAMAAEGIALGIVLQDPIEGLKEYHKDAVVPTS